VSSALSAPFLAAAGVLCVSGVAKLRSPRAAIPALVLLRLPASSALVRAVAAAELTIGVAALIAPATATALAVAAAYATFAVVATRLAALRASCGCFGESEAAASPVQALLSGALAVMALVAAAAPPGGLHWVLAQPAATAAIVILGLAGGVYGLVIAYTQLPSAWGAWSTQ
jgi:hypothetical protein